VADPYPFAATGNYGSALRDCAKALSGNLKCTKAWYRSALALNALERFEEAVDVCTRCLAYDPQNAAVKVAYQKAEKGWDAQKIKRAAKSDRLRKEREKAKAIADALEVRVVATGAAIPLKCG